MSARRTPIDRMILSQQQGPDSAILAGWGLIAVFAFLFAFGAWKFNSRDIADIVIAPIEPPTSRAEQLSQRSHADDWVLARPALVMDVPSVDSDGWPPDSRAGDTLGNAAGNALGGANGEDLGADLGADWDREVRQLRQALDTIRAENAALSQRLASLELGSQELGGQELGSIDTMTTASITEPDARFRSTTAFQSTANGSTTIPLVRQTNQSSGRQPLPLNPAATPQALTAPEPTPLDDVSPARAIPMQSARLSKPAVVIQSTQFAIDLGRFSSRDHAREGWQKLKALAPDIVLDARPRTVSTQLSNGEVELRLLGGPYANVANAAQACAALSQIKIACRPGKLRGIELSQ